MSPDTITIRAPAKVNLALSVGPPLASGMHPIASWMACLELHDEVHVTRADHAFAVEWAGDAPVPSEIDWPAEKDLCVRALRELERYAGRGLACAIRVTKRTPVGAGLGGGSADAAATLIAVDRLFGLGTPREELRSIAHTLGSDIPFFIDDAGDAPAPAIVSGLGDAIERVGFVAAPITLVLPAFGCPTGGVYRAYDAAPVPLQAARVRELSSASVAAQSIESGALFNDLAGPACAVAPALGDLRAALEGAVTQPVHVTGSGSTLFLVGALGDGVCEALMSIGTPEAVAARVLETRLLGRPS